MGSRLPFGIGNLDWGDWLYGLFAGFIGGGANAVYTGVAVSLSDPSAFNVHTGKLYRLIVGVFLVNGIMNMMAFLRTKPLPEMREIKTTLIRTETEPTVQTTTRIEETHQEPLDGKKNG